MWPSRPAPVPKTVAVIIVAFIGCFGLGLALCFPLMVSGDYAPLCMAMAVNSVVCFALPGFIARHYAVGKRLAYKGGAVDANVLIMVFLTAFLCQPFILWASYIDSLISSAIGFPADLGAESNALIAKICVFDNVWHWAVAIIVVALLPAVSEELFFRGALLPLLRRMTGNWHVAVGLTAVIFSAVHMDPSGFISRAILGAILGALFVITRSLWAPMLFHFTNNAMAVVSISMAATPEEAFAQPVEEPDALFTCVSIAFTIFELYFIEQAIKRSKEQKRDFTNFTRVG